MARGRIMEESFNEVIRVGDVQVRPGDVVMADVNGVVIVPVEGVERVLAAAEEILAKEEAMVDELQRGVPIPRLTGSITTSQCSRGDQQQEKRRVHA